MATATTMGAVKVGECLSISDDGTLSVRTTNEVGADNTLPVTAACVHSTVGNIETLLETI